MDSETDTDTHSLCDSEISRENYKSPESSDCEGYATPLASSLTDISTSIHHGIIINVPDDNDETSLDSGERTPVSTHRAISPPVVKQIIYLQKPKILVMTQREILDESSSEEEFYDVDDVQIRDVAQQLLNGVSNAEAVGEVEEDDVIINDYEEQRPDTPIVAEDSETTGIEMDDVISEDEERLTPIQVDEQDEKLVENGEAQVVIAMEEIADTVDTGSLAPDVLNTVTNVIALVQQNEDKEQLEVTEVDEEQKPNTETDLVVTQEDTEFEAPVLESPSLLESEEPATMETELTHKVITDVTRDDDAPLAQPETCDNTFDNVVTANNVITECVHNSQILEKTENVNVSVLVDKKLVELKGEKLEENDLAVEVSQDDDVKAVILESEQSEGVALVIATDDNHKNIEDLKSDVVDAFVSTPVTVPSVPFEMEISEIRSETIQNRVTDRPEVLYEQMPADFSEIVLAKTPIPEVLIPHKSFEEVNEQLQLVSNQETVESDPMPTLVISDEVKTSPTTDNVFYNRSTHEVKVDFDGYSSGKEESLSSSTSSESFEFAEPVSTNHVQDERTQALRNSIIERYPSNETDEDELDDDVGDDFDEDLLAVKQISAEVEQLVAAINAFGRDEEQQMSAYLVGKKMAAEKKRKSAMDTGLVVTSPSHDQTVQTDNDSFILVDRRVPIAMESLQIEIDKLQADLEMVKIGEKELLKINSQLKAELEESQQTIDGIEVEAEQQYTELTSEIDELCDMVTKKDQDIANLKEKIVNLSASEINLRDDVESQRIIVQRQKEIIESLREDLDAITKKLSDVTKLRDKAIEEVTVYKLRNQEKDRFLSREAQMSMEIEDLQRELNKQKLILNQTSMAKLADTFDRRVLHLENELRERDMLICKQNQIINNHRKSPTGSVITTRKMQPRTSVLAAAGNLPSAGSSSESFQHGLDAEAKEALFSFILCDRHQQLANIYNIGRILDLNSQEERTLERHLTKDRFT